MQSINNPDFDCLVYVRLCYKGINLIDPWFFNRNDLFAIIIGMLNKENPIRHEQLFNRHYGKYMGFLCLFKDLPSISLLEAALRKVKDELCFKEITISLEITCRMVEKNIKI